MEYMINDFLGAWVRLDKSIALYPVGHSAIGAALEYACETLNLALDGRAKIDVFCFKGHVRSNEEMLDPRGRHVQEFSALLAQRGIVRLTMYEKLSKDTIELSLRLLHKMPSKHYLVHHPEIIDALNQLNCIEIQALDLKSVRFTVGYHGDEEASLWQQLLVGDQGEVASEASQAQTVKRYKTLLQEQLQSSTGDVSGFFHAVDHLFGDFAPYVQSEMVAETLSQLDAVIDRDQVAHTLESMPNEMVIKMLEQVRDEGKEISPALLKLLGALHSAEHEVYSGDIELNKNVNLKQEHVEKLIEREFYEQYVLNDYRDMLLGLSQNVAGPDTLYLAGVDRIKESFQQTYLANHILEGFTRLVINAENNGISVETLDVTIGMIDQAMIQSQYHVILTISDQLDAMQGATHEARMLTHVMRLQQYLKSQLVVQRIAKDFVESDGNSHLLDQLILRQFTVHAPWLIDYYLSNTRTSKGQHALNLLLSNKGLVGERVIQRIPHSKSEEMGALYNLLRHCEGELSAVQMQQLLNCKYKTIRMEAIKRLLNESSLLAVPYLTVLLLDKDLKTQLRCLELIRHNDIRHMKNELIAQIPFWYIPREQVQVAKKAFQILQSWQDDQEIKGFVDAYIKRKFSLTPGRMRIIKGR